MVRESIRTFPCTFFQHGDKDYAIWIIRIKAMLNDIRIPFRSFSPACGGLRGKFFLRKNLMSFKSTLISLTGRPTVKPMDKEELQRAFRVNNVWI